MPELMLELFSEEIPARMQARAAEDLKRLVCDGLKAEALEVGAAHAFATPRRLALVVEGVSKGSPAAVEDRKGPRVGAPEPAIQGFLKATGLSSIGAAVVIADPKKGDYYVARIERPGRPAAAILAKVVPDVCAKFPWPKSMRFNRPLRHSAVHAGPGDNGAELLWVRPLHTVLCLLDGEIVPFDIAGIASGNTTRGHRFHAPEPFAVTGFKDYGTKLKQRRVLLPASERAAMIAEDARALAKHHKLQLIEDQGLLAENAGLTEWPVVLMGAFDAAFLEVPAECIVTSLRNHQKCFSLRHPRTGKLANRFVLVANLVAADGGAAIVAGNEKVIRARLADARFFWQKDLEKKLEPMHFELKGVTFHAELGTQWDRMERITELARRIAGAVDAEPDLAGRAAQLCKADLVSGMVGEFPELQGLMGRYYAEAERMNPKIARAIEEHYKPKGPNDAVPTEPVSIAVALADKLDTLVGFWAIGEKPTGSGDPYQLRRAALGVIRIVLENDLRLPLFKKLRDHAIAVFEGMESRSFFGEAKLLHELPAHLRSEAEFAALDGLATFKSVFGESWAKKFERGAAIADDLLSFFADRLKVHLREQGARHDLIDAVFSLGGQDDLALMVKRVEALGAFLETDDGEHLLTGVKRAINIIAIEEKRDRRSYTGKTDGTLLAEPQEKALFAVIEKVKFDTKAAINVENFSGAMRALAELRPAVDAFFDHVTVNVDQPRLRENRLKLLSEIRAATLNVADFSKIAG